MDKNLKAIFDESYDRYGISSDERKYDLGATGENKKDGIIDWNKYLILFDAYKSLKRVNLAQDSIRKARKLFLKYRIDSNIFFTNTSFLKSKIRLYNQSISYSIWCDNVEEAYNTIREYKFEPAFFLLLLVESNKKRSSNTLTDFAINNWLHSGKFKYIKYEIAKRIRHGDTLHQNERIKERVITDAENKTNNLVENYLNDLVLRFSFGQEVANLFQNHFMIRNINDLRRTLMPYEIVLDIWTFNYDAIGVFILTKHNIEYQELNSFMKEYKNSNDSEFRDDVDLILNWGKYKSEGGFMKSFSLAYIKLENFFIEKLLPYVENYSKITIVPHGYLSVIPVNNFFLGHRDNKSIEISSLPACDILINSSRISNIKQYVFVGNPDKSNIEYSLPFSERENYCFSFENSEALIGSKARKQDLLERLGPNTFLHFSGHGLGFAQNSILSYIRLHDDIITVKDIIETQNIDLMGSIVFLNGCQTSTKDYSFIDELNSLENAFLFRNAYAVISTTWNVDDLCASEFALSLMRGYCKSENIFYAFNIAISHVKNISLSDALIICEKEIIKFHLRKDFVEVSRISSYMQNLLERIIPSNNIDLQGDLKKVYKNNQFTNWSDFIDIDILDFLIFDNPFYWSGYKLTSI